MALLEPCFVPVVCVLRPLPGYRVALLLNKAAKQWSCNALFFPVEVLLYFVLLKRLYMPWRAAVGRLELYCRTFCIEVVSRLSRGD